MFRLLLGLVTSACSFPINTRIPSTCILLPILDPQNESPTLPALLLLLNSHRLRINFPFRWFRFSLRTWATAALT
ncbi:hypothetical protein BKA64DRAFT_147073 [Cadophora sp. MPI-SDFR-AT-0126]|nr:hypothetical protein BKA64DRAFT_147073 [Leotiomycetes sp. MPI-SDFR-AT-0126]